MGKIQIPKQIRSEDFDEEQRGLVDKIAGTYNDFVGEVYRVLTNGIDYENLNRQITVITVTMSATGAVLQEPKIKVTASGKVRGVSVLSAVNVNKIDVYPTTAPFVSWSLNANLLTILNITGLQPSSQYQLTLELIV